MENLQTFCPHGKLRGPIVPEHILRSSLSHGAKLLYAVLCNLAGKNDHCFPAHATLAEMIGASVSSIKKYLKELVTQKLIQIRGGLFHASSYYLLKPVWLSSKSMQPSQPVSGYDRKPVFTCPQVKSDCLINFNNIKYNISPYPQIHETGASPVNKPCLKNARSIPEGCKTKTWGGGMLSSFEEFWKRYPRKEAKALARQAWQKLGRLGQLPPLETILHALDKFTESHSWQKENGRYIQQAANWLKGQRWLDEDIKPESPITPLEKDRRIQLQAQKKELENKAVEQNQKLGPEFKTFISKFPNHQKQGLAYCLWRILHDRGNAPTADNVPENPQMSSLDFLKNWQRGMAVC